MPDVRYVPGPLTAVAGDQCWALVEAPPDSPAVTRIWKVFVQGAAADTLLAALLADGVGGVPGFALLTAGTDGRYRLFCRGAVGATVVAARSAGAGAGAAVAPEHVDGAGLLTWRERVVQENTERIFLGVPPSDTALRLPAASGVLLAGCMIIELTNLTTEETAAHQLGRPSAQTPAAVAGGDWPPQPVPDWPPPSAPEWPPRAAEDSPRPKTTIVSFPDTVTITDSGRAPMTPLVAPYTPTSAPYSPAPYTPTSPVASGAVGPSGLPGLSSVGRRPGGADGPLNGGGGADDNLEYDFLWGSTQARSVADAAIRPADGDPAPWGPAPLNGHPVPGALPGALPGAGARPPGQFQGSPPPSGRPGEAPAAGMHSMPAAPAEAPGRSGSPGGLIDVPPWLSGPGRPVPGRGGPDDSLFAPPAPRGEVGPGDTGFTMKRGELSALAAAEVPDRIGPVVPALICPAGHLNPPTETTCRRCGAALPHDPTLVPRPVLGALRLSLGDVIALDRDVVMGRNPGTDFAGHDGEERPHVVKLPSADGDISRTHLRVTLDGWHVMVTDLNSTNGTLVTLPGRDAEQLRPGEPVPIRPGTVVTLAEGIDFRYEVTD
jgi:FHA domain